MADIADTRGQSMRLRLPVWLPRLDWRAFVLPVALIVYAEIAMFGNTLQSISARAPSQVAVALFDSLRDGTMLLATYQTLASAVSGIVIGGLIGLTLGIVFGLSSVADRLMGFTVESIRPIPSAALIPVVLLMFGFGYTMEVALLIPACTFPVMIFTRAAVASTEPRLLDLSRALGLSYVERIWKIILPAALPRIFVGFRLSAGLALVVAVTVEVAANPQGLGHLIMHAQETLQPELMWASLVWIALVGWLLNAALMLA